MAKKRVKQPDPSRRSSSLIPNRWFVISLFSLFLPIILVILYRVRYNVDNVILSVYNRGLVKVDTNYQQILSENSRVSANLSHRHYSYPILAYITPWNSKGYDLAKRFNSKLTHLSPVWYDLKSEGSRLVLEGRHNADLGWISDLRLSGNALVLPRIFLKAFPKEFLKKKKQREKAIELIVTECREMEYDGVVLESWSRWVAYGVLHDPEMRNTALQFIKQLGHAMHAVRSKRNSDNSLQLFFVIGPPRSSNFEDPDFAPEDLEKLGNFVDGFSLMTYDFSNPQNPGPNAPIMWVQSILQMLLGYDNIKTQYSCKIFLGINFYGNDFVISQGSKGGGAITGRDYLTLLEKHKPVLQWDEKNEEHVFIYSDDRKIRHAVFYPSLKSISARLEVAHLRRTGISIWEIGQGLDYFFDLL